ncbi:oligosaccharide flippase family protein [Niveibacterium sp. 24ML]|uniref:oligosaccharide flippase family protein n=1 Tax=Niveibacterium sp. 24ML TaxID=2985512 RepID=UPI002270E20B|nr:oligosaccharide flippase family protein [Niveibacterium sp. 24ML]MCX9156864.1 oligosaccharide flippase family protein [Niveibacterium sp. 24ML]
MTSIRRAAFLSLAQRYVAFVIQLATSIVLARLLSPSETGVFSLAAAIVSIAQLLRDFGIGEYVVQEKDMSRERLRSVLGVSLAIAWAIAAALFASAGYIADYYHEAGVRTVVHILALNFVLLPIGTTTFAVLTKELAFKEIFYVQTSSTLIGAAAAILLAFQGHSYLSLAWSSVFSSVTTVLVLAIVRPAETFMLPRFSGLREIGIFGGTVTLGRFLDQLCRRAPDMFIAQGLGFHAVGINSKATSLLDTFQDFFVSGISRVATPAFAQTRHANGDSVESYIKAIRTLAIFPFVFFLLLALLAEPLVLALFGKAWLEAVPLLRIGAIGGIMAAPYFLGPPLLTAHGHVKDILKIQVIGGIVFLGALYFAASHSLVAVAATGVAGSLVRIAMIHGALHRNFGMRIGQLFSACRTNVLIAVLTGLLTAPVLLVYNGTVVSALAALLAAAAASIFALTLGIFALDHPLAAEVRIFWRNRVRFS